MTYPEVPPLLNPYPQGSQKDPEINLPTTTNRNSLLRIF